jgi:7-carboxy-7-deazaguanine synthase
MSLSLRVTEIFYSIQGESSTVGFPTVFVRLTGCPLRCTYCDTEYAFTEGRQHEITEVMQAVAAYTPQRVTVTGGEPLAQKNAGVLLTQLCDQGYEVSLETSGALPIEAVDPRVMIVMDIKTPGSQEMRANRWENIAALKSSDQVKFVILDYADYQFAQRVMAEHRLLDRCQVLFSPVHDELPVDVLADWILADRLPVRLQVQLHKYIWGDARGK